MSPCLAQGFGKELGGTRNLKLHIVSAVYGAKRAWAIEHDGEEPPPHVVRSFSPWPCCRYNDVFAASII